MHDVYSHVTFYIDSSDDVNIVKNKCYLADHSSQSDWVGPQTTITVPL